MTDVSTRSSATPPLQAMEPWEIELWKAHAGTWTSSYTVRDAQGEICDAYDAVNEINLDLERNVYAQRNTYTRTKRGADGTEERVAETRGYTAFWDGRLMIISGKVLEGSAIASRDASRRVITLNFHNTKYHPMGEGMETFELITLGENGINRARCMQHWKDGVLEKICSVFGEKRISAIPAIDVFGNSIDPLAGGSVCGASEPEPSMSALTKLQLQVRNPRTGLNDCSIDITSISDLNAACATARAGQRMSWAVRSSQARADLMLQWAKALEQARDSILAALVSDTGRLSESETEFMAAIGALRRWCGSAPALLGDDDGDTSSRPSAAIPFIGVQQSFVPYDLVGVIAPWNFPLLLALIDAIPALLAGCAVIIKPSEVTPRFVAPLRETIAAVPPLAEVLHLVVGGAELGRAVVRSVDSVCFTGSVATGRHVAVACAKRMIPAFLELGGKDAVIVLNSADVERAAAGCLWGATVNNGASCLSIERVYADASVHDAFANALVRRAQALRSAFPTPASGEMGPIVFEPQAQVIERHVRDAVARGARILCGGKAERLGGGIYWPPTVIVDCDHTMLVMTEESFGPIIPVMRFAVDNVDEAVRLANDSVFGLSGAVFGAADAAAAVAARMRCGAVSVNDAALTALVHDAEKASFGLSGVGPLSRMGDKSIQRFLRPQALLTNSASAFDPWWFRENTQQDGKAGMNGAVLLHKFCSFLCGDFDNSGQVAALDASIDHRHHPYARHITRILNHRIRNLPPSVHDGSTGVFVLEESDYVHPADSTTDAGAGSEGRRETKPLLLFIELRQPKLQDAPSNGKSGSPSEAQLWLHSYRFPAKLYEGGPYPGALNPDAAQELRNSSSTLEFEYSDLSESPTFPATPYVYDPVANAFSLHARIELPGATVFTLDETISADGLSVMELLEQDGVAVTAYNTPIEYRRIPEQPSVPLCPPLPPHHQSEPRVSGLFEVCIGVEPGEVALSTALKYWATFGFREAGSEMRGALSTEECEALYGTPKGWSVASVRLEHGGGADHGWIRLMQFFTTGDAGESNGANLLKPSAQLTSLRALGARWGAQLTSDLYGVYNHAVDEAEAGAAVRYHHPQRCIVYKSLAKEGSSQGSEAPFTSTIACVRELLVMQPGAVQNFYQRYDYTIPNYGHIDDSSKFRSSQVTHCGLVVQGDAEQLKFYSDVLGLLETTTDRKVGYEDESARAIMGLEKEGEKYYTTNFDDPRSSVDVQEYRSGRLHIQRFPDDVEVPDIRDTCRPGALGPCNYTLLARDVHTIRESVVAADGVQDVTAVLPNEFGELSFSFVAPDGYFWTIHQGSP